MSYESPAGWIEDKRRDPEEPDNKLGVFHARQDCPRIRDVQMLRAVERPYSAARCPVCAKWD